jgi:DNA-directed RNA polymerase omega subunit
MGELNVDDLITKSRNKFLLSNAAAGRAKQIVDGSLPYVSNFDPNNPVITALREIAADKIKIKILSGPSKKVQEIIERDDEKPSALARLAREKKAPAKKKEKKKK